MGKRTFMNLHEYQSKQLFCPIRHPGAERRGGGLAGGGGGRGSEVGRLTVVVKAQVHAGGRGKAGGVKVAKDLDAVRAAAKAMLGTVLVTHQTGAEGLPSIRCMWSWGRRSRAKFT